MKNKIILLCIPLLLFGLTVQAQFTANGADLYHTGGKVGIGTMSPNAPLHILSAGGLDSGIRLEASSASQYGVIDFVTSSGLLGQFLATGASFGNGIFQGDQLALASYAADGRTTLVAGGGNGFINFATGGYGTGNERMRITNTGNVGIGTTIPNSKLHLRSLGGANTGITLEFTSTSQYSTIDFISPGGLNGQFFSTGSGFSNGIFTGDQIALASYATDGTTTLAAGGANGVINFATGGTLAANERMRIYSDGKVGINTRNIDLSTSTHHLHVNGSIISTEVVVKEVANWPDYVFDAGYNLRPLSEVESYINENGHLPNIPSAAEVAEEGIQLGSMNAKLLEKVEELTLYLLQQQKEIEALKAQVKALQEQK